MESLPDPSEAISETLASPKLSLRVKHLSLFKRLWGSFLLILGYLLSPLSWWNDLFFNLPFAYGFGFLASRFSPDFFLPAAIAGYWFSNIAGILLMQLGMGEVFQDAAGNRNLKKELLTGFVSSTVYTLLILGLIHFHILQTPGLDLHQEAFSLEALLPLGGDRP